MSTERKDVIHLISVCWYLRRLSTCPLNLYTEQCNVPLLLYLLSKLNTECQISSKLSANYLLPSSNHSMRGCLCQIENQSLISCSGLPHTSHHNQSCSNSPDCSELSVLNTRLHSDKRLTVSHVKIIVESLLIIILQRLQIFFFGIIFLSQQPSVLKEIFISSLCFSPSRSCSPKARVPYCAWIFIVIIGVWPSTLTWHRGRGLTLILRLTCGRSLVILLVESCLVRAIILRDFVPIKRYYWIANKMLCLPGGLRGDGVIWPVCLHSETFVMVRR